MKGFVYIDFETSVKGDFYIVGTEIDGRFEQIVLTPKLRGFAGHHKLKVMQPDEFAKNFCSECVKDDLKIAAYSTAEMEMLKSLTTCTGIEYLNLRKAAKKWINQYMDVEFDELPELGVTMKLIPMLKRQLRNSLYSVSRLLDETQLNGMNFPHFRNYGWRHTSTHFKTVIDALVRKQQEYGKLAKGQKKAGTKALKHNRFDVEILPRLHKTIAQYDEGIIEESVNPIN